MAIRFGLGRFRFADGSAPRAGVVLGEEVVDPMLVSARLFGQSWPDSGSLHSLLQHWEGRLPELQRVADAASASADLLRTEGLLVPLQGVTTLPPVQSSSAVFCAGANYRTHVQQLALAEARAKTPSLDEAALATAVDQWIERRTQSGRPYVFLKLARTSVGAHDDLVIPCDVAQCDFELELAAVIGKRAYRVPHERALEHVAGYTIANDVSARERILPGDTGPLGADWLAGKCSPTFLPIGPFIVPRVHAGDPASLRLQLRLNGELMQDAYASDLLFDVGRLIEHVASITPLEPGDVILTGSPAGNGAHHGRFLAPGDVLECTITGLGSQRTRCVAERDEP